MKRFGLALLALLAFVLSPQQARAAYGLAAATEFCVLNGANPRTLGVYDEAGFCAPLGSLDSSLHKFSILGEISAFGQGGVDDNSTNNASVLNNVLLGAPTVRFVKTQTGTYRTGSLTIPSGTDLLLDPDVTIANADGTPYSGSFGLTANVSPNVFSSKPALLRVFAIDRLFSALPDSGDAHETSLRRDSLASYNYGVSNAERSFILAGQLAPSSGGTNNFTGYTTWYNNTNGPGVPVSCTATAGTPNLTGCSVGVTGAPALTATNPTNGQPWLYGSFSNGVRIVVASGFSANSYNATAPGLANGTYALSWTANGITLSNNWAGAGGPVSLIAISGRSEMNNVSLGGFPVGATTASGPGAGTNWYSADIWTGSPISSSTADQAGYLAAGQFGVVNMAPGSAHDVLHNGLVGMFIGALPYMAGNASNQTYPVDYLLQLGGWSGPWSCALIGGQCSGATYAAQAALQVGGLLDSVYAAPTMQSYVYEGVNVKSYAYAGVHVSTPASSYNSSAPAPTYSFVSDVGSGPAVFGDDAWANGVHGKYLIANTAYTATSPTSGGSIQNAGDLANAGAGWFGGFVTAAAYKIGSTAGVSCSGTPTSSFASQGGVVTHC